MPTKNIIYLVTPIIMSAQTPSVSNNPSNDSVTPAEVSHRHASFIEQRVLRLKGKERYEYLLNRKTNELKEKKESRADTETQMFALPSTRLNDERRKELTSQLKHLDKSIAEICSDISMIQQRIRGHLAPATLPISTSIHPFATTDTPFAPGALFDTPAPRRCQQDPFPATAAASAAPALLTSTMNDPDSANPDQFKVPRELPKFRTGSNAITEAEIFTRQFELQLRAHGINIDYAWPRLLPLCLSDEMLDWLDRTHRTNDAWAIVRASLHRNYGNPTRRREAIT